MTARRRLVVITNIVAPYRLPTFRELANLVELHVLFSAASESNREWSVETGLPFPSTIVGGVTVRRGRPEPLYVSPRVLRELVRLRPDAVMVGGYSVPALYACAYCAATRSALIEFSEGTRASERELGRLARAGRRVVARGASAAVGTSSAAVERLVEIGIPADRCFRAPYALDLDHRPTRRFDSDGPARLLFVGQLVARKGLDLLLRELATVLGPDARLTVAGSGPDRALLEALTSDLGLSDRVTFVGFVDQPNLPALYADHDVFLFPTVSDTFGVVTLEAMAAGLPVVASVHAGSTADFVDSETGWTCDPLRAGSIARAVGTALLARPSWGEIGRRNRVAITRSSPTDAAQQIVAAMDRALSPNGAS